MTNSLWDSSNVRSALTRGAESNSDCRDSGWGANKVRGADRRTAGILRRAAPVDREETTLGLRCFGVAISHRTPARDAISCSVPVARLSPGPEEMVKDALFDARDRLTLATRRL